MKDNQTIAQFLGITKFPFELKNEHGYQIYSEDSYGYWTKREFNTNGNRTYFENSDGFWSKKQYDANGNETHYETSEGFWIKQEFDAEGNEIFYLNSNGKMRNNRPKQVEFTLAEIATKLNIPVEQLRIKE